MKKFKIFLILFTLLFSLDLSAQYDCNSVIFRAPNAMYYPNSNLRTNNSAMNQILDRYNIASFTQYRPDALTQKVLDLYKLVPSDLNQVNDLYNELMGMNTIPEITKGCLYEVANCTPETFNDSLVQQGAGGEYYLNGMNIPCAWSITHGSSDQVIAMVDVYFDLTHPDMTAANLNKFESITNVTNFNNNTCSHGFATAGAAAAIVNNNICTVGSGYNTRVAGYIVGNGCTGGNPTEGAWRAYKDNRKIINISFTNTYLTKSEVEEMVSQGVVLTVAANGNGHSVYRDIEGVISVGVADINRNHVDYGGFTPGVSIYALCKAVPRLQAMGGCAYAGPNTDTGMSSFGAPTVAGIVALMKSENPCLTPADIEKLIVEHNGGLPNNAASLGITAGIMDAYEAVLAAKNGVDYIVDSEVIIDKDRSFSGDVIINNGGKLIIKSTVSLATNSRIVVKRGGKLELDGGTLTSCNEKWEGIIVEGNATSQVLNQVGFVQLKNNSVIKNALIGISCNPTHIAWPNTEYYGGLVQCDNSTIKDCNKGVEFMKYGVSNLEDNSYFNLVTFENCNNGITTWANNGIEITNCNFDKIKENGVLPYDSRVIIKESTFDEVKTGVNVHTTMPIPFSSEIISNNFYTSDESIKANASVNSTSLDIVNNNFYGSYFGVKLSGASFYHLERNDFVNQNTSTVFYDTNLGTADQMRNNNISNSEVGSLANKSNYTVYVDNCFGNNVNADLNVSGASIFPYQYDTESANSDEAAGNCFSKGTTKDIYTSSSSRFDYYIKTRETINCKNPSNPGPGSVNSNGNYGIVNVDNDDEDNCGSETGPGVVIVKYRQCPIPVKLSDIKIAIANLKSLIAFYEPTASTNSYHYFLVKKYKACLKRLQISVPNASKKENELNWRQDAITYLNNETDFQVRTFAYGLMVENNELSNARNWLNGLTRNTEEIEDFYTIQNINLDYLANRSTYQLSQANKTLLYNLGRKDIPFNGFARSLYYVLTGNEVPIDLDYGGIPTSPRNSLSEKDWKVENYPNPLNGQDLVVKVQTILENDNYDIEITDITGKPIYKSSHNGNREIKVNNSLWQSGLYILRIISNNKVVKVSKVTKI